MLRKIVNRIKKFPIHGFNFLLGYFGYTLARPDALERRALEFDRLGRLAVLIAAGGNELSPESATELVSKSRSQLGQDLFALANSQMKRAGYFVEFGATDGIKLSNTYLLETSYDWQGILAEPAKVWHSSLQKNRKAKISKDVVWSTTGIELLFSQTGINSLSTLTSHKDSDMHQEARKDSIEYRVKSISLLDLLETFEAPRFIDFLSIDTEGSEVEILRAFDFTRYTFGSICVEHNYTPQREEIFQLLSSVGYRRVLQPLSYWDDWYVRSDSSAE
jgi:FkbM family methyltransferase